MSTLNDTDLFVVEREGVQYKVEAVDVVVDPLTGELESPVEVLTPLNGAGIGAGVPYNPISSPIVTVGGGGSVDFETTPIQGIDDLDPDNVVLTFTDDVDENPALKFFSPGDFLGVSGATDVICNGRACQTEVTIGNQGGVAITTSSSSITRIVVDCEGTDVSPKSKLTLSSTLLTSGLDSNTDCTVVQASNSTGSLALLTNGQRETLIFSFAGTTGTWYLSGKRVKIYNVYTDQAGGASVSNDVNVVSTGYPGSNTMTVSGNIFSNGDTLSKTASYGASLICSDNTELANMIGPILMTDSNGDLVTPQTSEIQTVSGTAPAITLTFADSTDLEYFQPGDVVQGGDWNQDRVWSSTITDANPSFPGTQGFNGNLSTATLSNTGNVKWNATSFGLSGVVRVAYNTGNYAAGDVINDGVSLTPTVEEEASAGVSWYNLGTITLGQMEFGGSAGYRGFYAIEVDGKLLVDQGISDPNAFSVVSVDAPNSQMVVDGGTWSNGDTVSLPPLEASATDVIGVDGNTLQIDGVSGTWLEGLHIKGASISASAPSPDSVVFTSSNGGTTAVTGTDATLTSRVWTLWQSNAVTGPWTQIGEYVDTSANDSQDGATPWADRPDLTPNKYYQAKVKYTSDNANPIESLVITFMTGDA